MAKRAHPAATLTSRHFLGSSKGEGCDGVEEFAPPPSPPGRFFIPRLSFGQTPGKVHYDVKRLSRSLAAHPDRPLFYCDNCLFDRKTDIRLFEALLACRGSVVITPAVRRELEPWLASNPSHVMAKAILSGARPVDVRDYDTTSPVETTAFSYYANLLGVRKKMLELARHQFEETHRRPPDDTELRALRDQVHQSLGPRGYLIANKGEESRGSPNRFTDECLVYSAIAEGIRSGRPAIILTKDADIQEQFFKLTWLLGNQYRSMLFADAYAWDPKRFVTRPMPMDNEEFADTFTGNGNILVEHSEGIAEKILPYSFDFVPLRCFVLGDTRLTEMHFGAERRMEWLLRTKGETGGLNTGRLEGRNCHFSLVPMPIPNSLRGYAAIAYDRRIPSANSVAYPALDVHQAIFCGERFKRLVCASSGKGPGRHRSSRR